MQVDEPTCTQDKEELLQELDMYKSTCKELGLQLIEKDQEVASKHT